jgi:hypothetical protein
MTWRLSPALCISDSKSVNVSAVDQFCVEYKRLNFGRLV